MPSPYKWNFVNGRWQKTDPEEDPNRNLSYQDYLDEVDDPFRDYSRLDSTPPRPDESAAAVGNQVPEANANQVDSDYPIDPLLYNTLQEANNQVVDPPSAGNAEPQDKGKQIAENQEDFDVNTNMDSDNSNSEGGEEEEYDDYVPADQQAQGQAGPSQSRKRKRDSSSPKVKKAGYSPRQKLRKHAQPLRKGASKPAAWSPNKLKKLMEMMDGGANAKEVSAALGGVKTVSSINAKYWRMKGNDPKAANKRKKADLAIKKQEKQEQQEEEEEEEEEEKNDKEAE